MKKLFYIFFLLLSQQILCCQNLVPNSSFEIYDTCPTSESEPGNIQLNHATGWFCPTMGTADYFNVCTVNPVIEVPQNVPGTQFPRTGNAYAGFISHLDDSDNYKEYVSIQMLSPMEPDSEYVVEFFVSLADKSSYGIDQLGILFTQNAISENNYDPILIAPGIKSDNGKAIVNIQDWVSIKGFYVASGNEQFITIGSFLISDMLTKSAMEVDPDTSFGLVAYYYIDDFKVQKLESWIRVPNVFTPNNDGINDSFFVSYNKITQFEGHVFNRWGEEVFDWNDIQQGWDGKTNNMNCPEGTYYYVVNAIGIEGKEYKKQGFLELLR